MEYLFRYIHYNSPVSIIYSLSHLFLLFFRLIPFPNWHTTDLWGYSGDMDGDWHLPWVPSFHCHQGETRRLFEIYIKQHPELREPSLTVRCNDVRIYNWGMN